MGIPVRPSNISGFSLVEIVIAMGILTFCLVAIMGLLPVGLSTLREATGATIEAQIVSQIASDVAQTPFRSLEDFASTGPYYFDNEGRRVAGATDAVYSAALVVAGPNYPGRPNDIITSLKNLQIRISNPRDQVSPDDPVARKKVYNIYVAKSDRST